MEHLCPLTICLPEPVLLAARDAADRRDITLGQLIRRAVEAELRRGREGKAGGRRPVAIVARTNGASNGAPPPKGVYHPLGTPVDG